MRDFKKYLNDFDQLPFEAIQASFRRKSFIENLKFLPTCKRVLEVGCGESSIFESVQFETNVIVEPIQEFINRLHLRTKCDNITCINSKIENLKTVEKYDLIVASCILHEIENPVEFLNVIFKLIKIGGALYLDVPNAQSLHRHFAVATNYLKNVYSPTTTQVNMQQKSTAFDKKSLQSILIKTGFTVDRVGGHFIKPFHHARMQELVDKGFLSKADLNGLYKLAKETRKFESEIFAICKKA